MNPPLVSVVIPTYNREDTIAEAIQSALDQTYSCVEIIVVDDGSRDGTAQALAGFGERIRVIRQANAGPSAARNRGIESAQGEYIAFLDSDDIWFPTKLMRQVRLLEQLGPEAPCCLCNVLFTHLPYGRATSFALADLRPALEEGAWCNPAEVLINRFILFNQAAVVRKWALCAVGGFRGNMRILEDYDLALRLALLGPWGFVKAPLVSYGIGQANSLSRTCEVDRTLAPKAIIGIMEALPETGRLTSEAARRSVRRQLRASRLQLKAAQLAGSSQLFRAQMGRGLERILRWRDGVVRRSPLLPAMKVLPASEFQRN